MKLRAFSRSLLTALAITLAATSCSKESDPAPAPGPAQPQPQRPNTPPPGTDSLPAAGFYNNADGSPIYALLDGARTTIDIEIYQMSDAGVRASLRAALARGVRIRVVKEPAPLGDNCDVFAPSAAAPAAESAKCTDQKKLREEILAAGGAYVPFNKAALCADATKACFEHGKMVIADSTAALVSSGNLNASNLCNLSQNPAVCNRDFSMINRDADVVRFLGTVFENDLKATPYDLRALLDAGPHDRVTVSPFSLQPLIDLVTSAHESLLIENQYLKEPALNDAILAAAARGVHVEVTEASLCSFGPPSEKEANAARTKFTAFETAGISVRLLPSQFRINGKPGYLHSKAMVVDGKTAWVGSVNGSSAATSNNREFGILFSDEKGVNALAGVLSGDHASPDMETWEESLACKKDEHVRDAE